MPQAIVACVGGSSDHHVIVKFILFTEFSYFELLFKFWWKNLKSFLSVSVSPKSNTSSFVSSVPLREPTAQTSFVSDALKYK